MINDEADAVGSDSAAVPFVVRPTRTADPAGEPSHRAGSSTRRGRQRRAEPVAHNTARQRDDRSSRAGERRALRVAALSSLDDAPAGVPEPRPDVHAAALGEDAQSTEDAQSPADDADEWAPFGPLAPFVARPGVTDVFVNGTAGLWTDDGRGLRRDESWWCDERGLRDLAVRLVALGGRHVDEATPCVDVRLRDGMRVHVVLPPISTGGTLVSIRIPRRTSFRFGELVDAGMVDGWQAARLRAAIAARENLLVTGPAGSGKTTLLSALLAEAPDSERLVCIEDVAELRVRHPHVVSMEARQPNLEGAGEVGLARLVREALRMRPDRVIVGECRGSEIRELLAALNTGHDGGAGTVHANSLEDVPARLEALGALAGMSVEAVARQTVSAINLVVQLERVAGIRRVAMMGRFDVDVRGRLTVVPERESR